MKRQSNREGINLPFLLNKIMENFWKKFKDKKGNEPIWALAPMAGYTDSIFRIICKEFGADVVYSEMASAVALASAPAKTLELISFEKKERPYIVQLFGSDPKHFQKAIELLTNKRKLSKFQIPNFKFKIPDGIDINFGCPVRKVAKQGAGAVLMNNIKLARDIIKATVGSCNLTVSIKIRSQVGKVSALEFLDKVGDVGLSAIMIHGRTLAQGHSGHVNWEIIKKARDYFGGIILANGGVMSADDAFDLLSKTQADGIGIARGALGRPWIFKEVRSKKLEARSNKDIYNILSKHAEKVWKLKGGRGIVEYRKHAVWYVKGMEGASELRQKLVNINCLDDLKKIKV